MLIWLSRNTIASWLSRSPASPPASAGSCRSLGLVCRDTQGLDNDDLQTDGMQLASSTASALGSSAPQQISAPGNSPQQSGRADDASSGAWSVLPKRTGGRRERSSPAQFRRHGPFAKAALPSVLWTLDPADDGGELVAGVEAEALSAARAVAAAARELASRALGFEL